MAYLLEEITTNFPKIKANIGIIIFHYELKKGGYFLRYILFFSLIINI